MDKTELILYGAATYLAIKSLLALMSDYRQQYKRKLADEVTAATHSAPKPSHHAGQPAVPPNAAPANQPAALPAKNAAKPEAAAKAG